MSDHETKCTCGTYKTAEALCSAHFVAPVTAPRTSPLTEEEAHRRAAEMVDRWDPKPTGDLRILVVGDVAAALLRVDSEARADLDEAVRQAVYDVLDDVADLDDGETDVLATVKMWRDDPGAYSRLRDDARHPTPSTPTTTEER